ncbi:NADH dehydrogenase [ubiquinone] 1 alpha subcomplex subunit [Thalictrum thalictroides]|uniref:NADH dehydrogenase [ubiquinone] 1 alpha subcomplex subunit n=1 Tax=Thalictrum thalictroides TaxID=46969 RepID=A0A7J6XC66_THATH|nr:NADH dehydrogenase [ubiquinone] 1 alpha subcomplex subunit [Thalictrum thalictroides]
MKPVTNQQIAQGRSSQTFCPSPAIPLLANYHQVIDMLLFTAMEELNNIVEHAKQRHHIIGQYVVGKGLMQDRGTGDQDVSGFLENFYTSSYS